jgi:mono/diheme cytochrome c family protein
VRQVDQGKTMLAGTRSNIRRLVFGATLGAAATCGATMAGAVDDIKVPSNPTAKAAFDVFDRNCARCHQVDRLVDLDEPMSGFGNVLRLDEIAENAHLVDPGNPHNSFLFKRILGGQMPPPDMGLPVPSEADIKAVEAWIESLKETCDPQKLVTSKDIVALIAADLEKLGRPRARTTRYLTLSSLKNACVKPKELNGYAQGAIKLLNGLSRSSDVVRLEAIDADQTILRFNLDDVGWRESDWDLLLANYPYAVVPDTQLTHALEGATGTKLPYVRADWFAFTASRPPLYNRLLGLPSSFQALARDQGVDVDGNIRHSVAKRAGFQLSGVSDNNRLIERHASRYGYFWTSYDFGGNRERQSLFEFPLGPGGRHGFNHDGGETIFSLPNGFQAYYLNTAKGDPIDKGPPNIVRDKNGKRFVITNGISCMGCHDQGIKKNQDEIRKHVVESHAFSKDIKDAVAALYPPVDVMNAILDDDKNRFTGAMIRAGLDPTLKLGGTEITNALANFYDSDVDLTLAAAEIGYGKDEFVAAAHDSTKALKPLIRRLQQGRVPRDHFEASFKALAKDISDDTPIDFATTTGFASAARPTHRGSLSITSDRDSYRQGDTPVFTIQSDTDCYLTLTNVDSKGAGTVLIPNKFHQDNRVRANAEVQFPSTDAPFQYRMSDKGVETIIGVCSDTAGEVDGIKHDFARSAFTVVDNYTRSAARKIAIEAKFKTIVAVPTSTRLPATSDSTNPVARSAIKVEVR